MCRLRNFQIIYSYNTTRGDDCYAYLDPDFLCWLTQRLSNDLCLSTASRSRVSALSHASLNATVHSAPL